MILKKMKKRDMKNQKGWKPYSSPADWIVIVPNVPKQEPKEAGDERPEVSDGKVYSD